MRFNKSLALIIVMLILLGIAIIDGSSILFGKWQLSDAADAAAIDAAIEYNKTSDLDGAKIIAQDVVNGLLEGAKVTKITPMEGGGVTIIVTKTASTLFVKKLGFTESWSQLRAEASANPPPS
jgi:Flp pilus assembly protein TadG